MTDPVERAAPAPRPRLLARSGRAGGSCCCSMLGLAVPAGGAYAAAYAAAGDRVPRGTTVAGVDIGGKTATEAQATLVAELRPRAAEPIPVTVDGTADVIDPESAGLGVDYVATVAAAGATRSWSPAWLWSYFTGGEPVDP
ncbi:MAG: hypothetical protein R2734_21125 [Nocardioides sp.]